MDLNDPAVLTVAHGAVEITAIVRGAADAPTVVLIPSLGRDAHDFDVLTAALAASGFRTVAVHPRGIGTDGSTVAVDAGAPVTLHDLAGDVLAVCDAVCAHRPTADGRVHVIGHALGNRIARCLTADRPDMVASLTLLAAGGLVEPDPAAWEALANCFLTTLSPEEHLRNVAFAFFADGNDATVWRDGWYPEIAGLQRRAVAATERDDWWHAVAPRTLVVQGRQDRIAVPANGRRYVAELRERGADATLVEIDGAGHGLLPEQPDAVSRAVTGFLAG